VLATDPKHRRRHVADRRPSAAGIGGDDDDAGKEQPVGVVRQQLAHQRDHDDGRRQVVKQRAQEEGYEADQPHQGGELLRPDPLGDHLEAIVRIDDLDDGHRAHQEEGNLRRAHQRFAKLVRDSIAIGGGHRVDCPQQSGTDQGRGRLVDLERVLERDGGIGDDEDNDQCGQHLLPLDS
jgi:hypothetical protein